MDGFLALGFTAIMICSWSIYHYSLWLVYKRLISYYPELWQKVTYMPSGNIEKIVYKATFLIFAMSFSAVYKLCMKKMYLEANDDVLIKHGSRVRRILISLYSSFVGLIIFMWISSLYRRCNEYMPEGIGAVWDCLTAIP